MILSTEEKNWIKERRVVRLTDKKEVQIYPMGAERYLSAVLFGDKKGRYPIRAQIEGKHVLVIPGYGNTAFLFAAAGAKSLTVYDKDPVTIAWMKAFKLYYHYRECADQGHLYPSIGELLTALTCWYPPLLRLPSGHVKHRLCWVMNPQGLRRTYIFYMLALVQQAMAAKVQRNFELDKDIQFHVGEVQDLLACPNKISFDTAFVPYLLGVKGGLETAEEVGCFMDQLLQLVPKGPVLVNPSRHTKEFYLVGKRYFTIPGYATIQAIPQIQARVLAEDRTWFRTQGLVVFGA